VTRIGFEKQRVQEEVNTEAFTYKRGFGRFLLQESGWVLI
jgi:hypothetical protein